MYIYVQNLLKYTPPRVDYYKFKVLPCEQAPRGALAAGWKRNESLQLCLWNLNSTSNSLVAPRQLSCKISTNKRAAETSTNVDVVVNFLSQVIVFGYEIQ